MKYVSPDHIAATIAAARAKLRVLEFEARSGTDWADLDSKLREVRDTDIGRAIVLNSRRAGPVIAPRVIRGFSGGRHA